MSYPHENYTNPALPGEIWKDVPGYEEQYQVSNLGRVFSLFTNRIRRPSRITDAGGRTYLRMPLYKDGVTKTFSVHRLMALAFMPEGSHLGQVDHINNDPQDNRLENLRWATQSDNLKNSKVSGEIPYKGVTKLKNRFRARLYLKDNKQLFVGSFDCPIKAAKAYDDAAVQHRSLEFTNLNFPERYGLA